MNIIYYALVTFIYLTPWFEGSAAKLGTAVCAVIIGSLTVIQACFRSAPALKLNGKIAFCSAVYACCIIIGVLQCIPGISFGAAGALYAQTGLVLHQPVIPFLSVSPEDTVFGIIKLLTYGAVFWLGLNAGVDYKRSIRLFAFMACMGGLYSIGALYQHDALTSEAAQLNIPFQPPPFIMSLVKNHFAALMGIHMVLVCVLLWQSLESSREHIRDMNRLFWRIFPLLTLLPLLGISLILTASRAGIASSVVGIVALFALLVFSQSRNRLWVVGCAGGIVVLFALLFSMGGTDAAERYAHMGIEATRRLCYQRDTLGAISFFPWTGSGLSTFPLIIKSYLSESYLMLFNEDILLSHAFNSYEETALLMGIPGFLALMTVILTIELRCLRGVFKRAQHKSLPAAAVAIGVILACHSLVDYSMQIPIIALLFCLISGIGFARAFPAEVSQ